MAEKRKITKMKRELPSIGTELKSTYKKTLYKARIVKDPSNAGGKAIKFRGNLYPSMTAAAKAITKNSINGWNFWKF